VSSRINKWSAVLLTAMLVFVLREAHAGPSDFQVQLRVVQACTAQLLRLPQAPGAQARKPAVGPHVHCTGGKPLYLTTEQRRPDLSTVEVQFTTVLVTF
jgi:hypothetical protein